MAKRIVPLIISLALIAYFGHRIWVQKKADGKEASFYGTVEATEILISPQVGGSIIELTVEEGDHVEKGALLARIDDSLYKAQVEQARAALVAAEKQLVVNDARLKGIRTNLTRTDKLLSSGSATEMQLDDLETSKRVLKAQTLVTRQAIKQAGAGLEAAEIQLSYTRLYAPLKGTVVRRDVELGETVFPGSSLMKIADLTSMEVKIYIPGPMLGKIKLGQSVKLVTDSYPDRSFTGSVAYIADEAEFTPKNVQTRDERVRLVYGVKVRVENPDGILKTGMPVDASFVKDKD